jgi:rubredoxin
MALWIMTDFLPLINLKPTTPDSLRLRTYVLGTGIEEKDEEEEEKAEEGVAEEEEEEGVQEVVEEYEHPDLLACRPCGLVFAHALGLKDHQIRGCPVYEPLVKMFILRDARDKTMG